MRSSFSLLFLLLTLVVTPIATAPPATATVPTTEATAQRTQESDPLYEDWHVLRVEGADSGFVHTRVTRETVDGAPAFVVEQETAMRINRMGSVVDITASQRSIEGEDGALVRIDSTLSMSNRPTSTVTLFDDGVARIRTTVMGETREKQVEVDPDCVGPYWLNRRAAERFDEPGASFVVTTWTTDAGDDTEVAIEIVGREDVIVEGRKRSLVRYESTLRSLGVSSTVWADDAGNPIKTATPMMGMTIESVFTDEATARRAYAQGGDLSPDVFRQSMIVEEHHLPASRSVDRARLALVARSETVDFGDLADDRQTLVKDETAQFEGAGGRVVVAVERRVPPADRRARVDPEAVTGLLATCLEPSSMLQSDHPDIVAIAREVVGDTQDPWVAAQRLEAWVEANLTEKSMDVGFASALEVCTDRAGDCTEHAVLLSALARAAGIPSRVAMGLLYIGGIWGGHAWSEVWIDGAWYALDGTVGSGSVDALHLTLARLTLSEGSPMAEFATLMRNIGEVDIEVLELTVGGRTIDATRDDLVRVEEGRYVNELWGLSFAAPEGFEVELAEPRARIGFDLVELEGRTADRKRVTVEVKAFDRVYARDLRGLLDAPAVAPGTSKFDGLTPMEVDGRTAWSFDGSGVVSYPRRLLIDADERCFLFEFSRINGDAQVELFRDLTGSIELDAGA